jgi:L-idonate 5-dehydrogenase
MTYLATRLTDAETIELTERDVPNPVPDRHVRLSLQVASLCGTDLHYFNHFANAGFQLRNPVSLGHEACARVIDANGSDLALGTLVALNPIMNCGTCPACQRGEINLCTGKKFPGSATTVPHIDGFFQEIIDHPAYRCRAVSNTVNPRHLTFAEPLACALHAVNKANVSSGDHVLVTGCGPMGLLTVAAAAARGARVTCLDLRPEAALLGQRIGAERGMTVEDFARNDTPVEFDVAIEASGAIPAFNLALDSVRRKGRISILSNIQPRPSTVNLHLIMLKEIAVVGSFQFNSEFEDAVRMIEAGKTNFDAMIAAVYPLHETQEALRLMQSGGQPGKILLTGLT